jgi:hypothetical protein
MPLVSLPRQTLAAISLLSRDRAGRNVRGNPTCRLKRTAIFAQAV